MIKLISKFKSRFIKPFNWDLKYVLILTALASFLFFFKLGSFSLYDAAETTYGEFIKQIRLTGDWFTMHYNGQIIFDKPPLYFWLATLATYLLGFNEFAIRFWAAVSGVLTVLTTYFLGKKFYHEKVGFLAAAVVMTAFQFIVQARIAELDMLLTLLLTLALFCFYLSYQSPNKNYYLLSYFFMGLATLVKGVIGVVLPLFTIFIFLFTKKELKRIREMKLMWGIIIIAIVSLPWFLSEYFLHGKVFLDFIFGFLFLSRFQTVVSGHPGPWYYYLFALLLGFAPWSAFLPYALWQTWENRNHNSELLTLCYLLPPFIVFSLAKTKLPNYILPFYPFFAIIVGKIWYDFLSKPKNKFRYFLFSFILLLVVVGLLMLAAVIAGKNYQGAYQEMLPQLYALAGILSLGTFLSFLLFLFNKPSFSYLTIIGTVFLIVGYLTMQTLPLVENYKGTKELAQKVNQVVKENESLAAYQIGNRPGVVFYNKKPIIFIEDQNRLFKFLEAKRGYCFTTLETYQKLKNRVKLFAQKGDLVVIH